jgi:deltex-like protein
MHVRKSSHRLAGHEDVGSIVVEYHISAGIQGPDHPNPGQPYHLHGFPRVGYLPDNQKGQEVLALLQKAWERRLIFTVGRSTTTGWDNCVIWNDIHHKTERSSNIYGHGYPDPNYLDNVKLELAAHGVV